MKRLNSEIKKIWDDNCEAFMIAGKDYEASRDIGMLNEMIKTNQYENKKELYKGFYYESGDVSIAHRIVMILIDMGNRVCLRQSEILGYEYCLSLYKNDACHESLDSIFDDRKKIFNK